MIVSSHHIYGMYDVHTEEKGNQEIVEEEKMGMKHEKDTEYTNLAK